VEIRIHTFFLLLLGLAISYSSVSGSTGGRGFLLWMLLFLAVAVREIARAIAAAWYGLELRSILLLPTGGLQQYATPEASDRAATPEIGKRLGIVGPIANLVFGLILAAIILTVAPEINLLERPWLTPAHLLRAIVWVNLLLAAVNLLPAAQAKVEQFTKEGLGHFPVCMAKTQLSLSSDPTKLGAPKGFTIDVRDIRAYTGAGWLVPLCGDIMQMPGLGPKPAALNIDIDADGNTVGLF